MNAQLQLILKRLKKPSVIISLVSQAASILIVLGIPVNEPLVITVATMVCTALVTLGVLSNPDTAQNGYRDDLLVCSNCGKTEPHVMVNGRMVCAKCGAVYSERT